MSNVHQVIANMGLLYTFVVGVWGLFLFLRRQPPNGNFNGALVIAEGLFVIEALVGLVLVLMGLMPARSIHFLYGVSAVLALPAAFTWARNREDSRAALIYGLTMLFLWGLAERATDTALHAGS